MNVESILSDELGTVARSLETPAPPNVLDLVRAGERERRRHRRTLAAVSGLVAAAVIGAVLVGGQIGKPDAGPTPAPQPTATATATTLRTGEPLRTWVTQDGRLHLNGVVVPGKDYAAAKTTGDVTTVANGPYDTGEAGVFVGTEQVGTIQDVYDASHILVAPDHRMLAYVAFENPKRTQLSIAVVRIDPVGLTPLGRVPVASLSFDNDNEARESLYSVADDGTVLYGGVASGHSWKPGTEPRTADVSSFLMRPAGFPQTDQALDIQLSPSGTWGAWGTGEVPGPDDMVLYTSVTVQHREEPATQWTFDFADRFAYVNIVFWETDEDVILYADTVRPGADVVATDGRYLRCDVVDHTCEVAPES